MIRTEEDINIDANQICDEFLTIPVSLEVKEKVIKCITEGIKWGEEATLREYYESTGRVASVIFRDGESLVSTISIDYPSLNIKNGANIECLIRPYEPTN